MSQIYFTFLRNFCNSKAIHLVFFLVFLGVISKAQPLSGNYNVGSGQTYVTITAAIADLTSKGVSAAVTFTLTDASYSTGETFPIAIGNYTGNSALNTVTIRPSLSLTAVTITSANTTATFDLNGAKNFTIDGRPGATGSNIALTIINTSTTGVAIRLINDALYNTIKYCDVKGQNTNASPALTTAAGVIFINSASSTGLLGNDFNTISYCNVHGTGTTTSTFPAIGICAYGTQTTPGTYNDSCTITACNIYDIYSATAGSTHVKVDLGNTAWSVTNNHLYQSTAIDYLSSTSVHRVLWITPNVANLSNAANGFNISGNFIGGNNAAGSGTYTITGASTYSFWAMDISVGLGAATSLQNNTITNIDMTTGNAGSTAMEIINIANGNANVGTILGNIIGSTTATPGITFTATANTGGPICIRTGGGTNNVINISNNIIAGIVLNSSTTVTPIFNGIAASGGTTVNITNNTIGSATIPNSINAISATTSTSIQSIRGIILNGTGISGTITGNLIANINSNALSAGTQASSLVGILVASTAGAFTISGNTIRNLTSAIQTSATAGNNAILGIGYLSTSGPAIISGNTIHTLKLTNTSTSAGPTIVGIYYSGAAGTNTIDKNSIHSFSALSATSSGFLRGIDIASGAVNVYNNMIRLGTDETGTSITNSLLMIGINEDGGTNNLYFNTVCINGSNVGAGTNNTIAFASSVTSISRELKNNIFCNTRSNGLSTGKNFALRLAGLTSQTIAANNYWNGAITFLSRLNGTDYTTFGNWKIATGQDTLSANVDPLFKNANGTSANVNLHIDTAGTAISYLESGGLAISGISTDIDNETRPGPTGSTKGGGTRVDIGADEFDGVPRPICLNGVAGTTVSSFDTVCVGNNFLLSLSGTTGIGVGTGYQWQSSINGINYSDISGATQNQFTAVGFLNTTYFRCVVSCIFGPSSSNSTAKKVTILNPQITATTAAQRCGPGILVLGATAAMGSVNWYANITGGMALDTGITFTTPSLTATTTYYVDAIYKGCASATRTPIVATIKPIPTITGITPATLCGPGSAVLSASTGAGTIDWYSSATGGTSLFSGLTYSTPVLSSTTTYYVEVTANGCVSASRTPITVTIIPLPIITSTTPAGTCGSGSVVLNATCNTGTIYWYSTSSGGTLIDSGTTYTTPVIFSPRTYYLEVVSGVCTSATRTTIVASVYSNPTINGTTSASGCVGDKVTLGAAASAGTINWYTTSTGGTSIATGTSFTTPSLTTTTTYYVDATNNGCVTAFRTPAKATINPLPTITGFTSASVCGSGSITLGASASGGLIAWYSDSIGGTLLGNGPSFTTSPLTVTDTFYIDTKDNGCTSYPRIAVIAKVKKIPTVTSTTPGYSCTPASVTLSAAASAGNTRWYNVAFGGTVISTGSTLTTPVLSLTTTYYVDAIDSGCVSATRTSVDATIYPSINKATTVNGFTISAAATGLSYQWIDCNNGKQPISGETGQSFTATKNGSYAVILKTGTCTDTSSCVVMSKIGFTQTEKYHNISIAPNPAYEFIELKSNQLEIGLTYTITDNLGRVLAQGTISSELQKINLQSLASGAYMLNIGDNKSKLYRFIKN